jgi:hypothetical protein
MVCNKIITRSESIQEKYESPTNIICVDHITDLINCQSQLNFN